MRRRAILSRFGEQGITKFALDSNGKALIRDDTQMTLFTANGLLTGITMNRMEHSSCKAELIVMAAYLDWFYTQTREEGKHEQITWLRELPEMYHKRAPGNTCMSACANIIDGKDVMNDSKGFGGIMRVAPMALLVDQSPDLGRYYCSLEDLAEGGCYIAEQTHQHPLGFLPAGLLSVLLYKLLPLTLTFLMQTLFVNLVRAGLQRRLGLLHSIVLFAILTALKMPLSHRSTTTAIATRPVPFVAILWAQFMATSISKSVIYSAPRVSNLKIPLNFRRLSSLLLMTSRQAAS